MEMERINDLRAACLLYLERKQSFIDNGFWSATAKEDNLPIYIYNEPSIKPITRELIAIGLVDWWYCQIAVHDCDTFITIEVKNGIHPLCIYAIPTAMFYEELHQYITKTCLDGIFSVEPDHDQKDIKEWAKTGVFRPLERWYGLELEDYSRIDLYPLDVTENTGLDILPCIYPRYTYDQAQLSRTPLLDIFNYGYFMLDGHWDSLTQVIAETGEPWLRTLTDEDMAFVIDTYGKEQWEPTPEQHYLHDL